MDFKEGMKLFLGIPKRFWNLVCEERHNRGLQFVVAFATFTLLLGGFWITVPQIRQIVINLKEIHADSVETRQIFAPNGEMLELGKSPDGKSGMQIISNGLPSVLQIGSLDSSPTESGCIQMTLKNSKEFVHLTASPAGSGAIWGKGGCRDK